MPDEKPHHQDETDQAKEETYVDAYNLRLNHSVTDIYIPLPGGDLALSVRRNVGEEDWNNTNGMTPDLRPDLPFGMGWSSNVCPNVHVVRQVRGTDTDPCLYLEPTTATVTDENGQSYRFILLGEGSLDGGGGDLTGVWAPKPSSDVDKESCMCTLDGTDGNYTFTKAHGVQIVYAGGVMEFNLIGDRNHPEKPTTVQIHTYTGASTVTDRFGARLVYGAGSGILPGSITAYPGAADTGGLTVQFTIGDQFISSAQDPAGNIWYYNYGSDGVFPVFAPTLASVTAPTMTTPDGPRTPITNYVYETVSEPDTKPVISPPPDYVALVHYHTNLISISDPLTNVHSFEYQFDTSKQRFDDASLEIYTVNGEPRWVSRVTLPDGSQSNYVQMGFAFFFEEDITGYRASQVTDAEGNSRVYDFGGNQTLIMDDWADLLAPDHGDIRRVPMVIYYTTTTITYYSGSELTISAPTDGSGSFSHAPTGSTTQLWQEIFTFNIDAGMSLSSVQDFSGNTTSYDYGDPYPSTGEFALFVGFYSQPTAENRVWTYSGVTETVTKTMHYGVYRVMDQSVDELGRTTAYELDGIGRRISEKITAPGATDYIQVTLFGYDTAIQGFLNLHTVQKLSTATADPTWVADLVKAYVPDASGRIAQEIVDPDRTGYTGLKLTTIHVYDRNGNKRSTQDPNGNFKWFGYDGQNRVTIILDEGPGTKNFQYDVRGNKIVGTDENSHSTNFEYDSLNRVITQTRVMVTEPDLVTRFTYNHVNSRTQVQDPNENTTVTDYDALQRPTQITDAAGKITLFEYDPADNPGASAFETSAFKPTKITDPRGVVTQMHYDSLYRLREKSVEYAPGLLSTVQTNTDAVGNIIETIDPLNHSVQKTYDALNRLSVTTWFNDDPAHPGGPLLPSTEQHFYTSTGLANEVIDELGNATDTVYDAAGRAIQLIGPAVDDGTGAMVRPVHQTGYDANGNAAVKIDPLGFETDFVFDVRNRKTLEARPEVLDGLTNTNLRPVLRWIYDNVGNVLSTIDERGYATDSTFDFNNRRTQVQAPSVPYGTAVPPATRPIDRPTTITAYDPNGNAIQIKDPNQVKDPTLNSTRNTYDVLNRLLTTENGADNTVTYTYDEVGNRLTVADGLSQTTTMAYDGLNRLTTTTDPASQVTTLGYDALNKVSRTDAASQVTNYSYNARNRLAQTTHVDRSVDDQTFTYDLIGKLLSVSEPGKSGQADVAYTYDALHRVSTETSSGQTHSYLYDLSDNRAKVTYGTTDRVVSSTYDALNRLQTMVETGRTTGYTYDLHGNLVTRTQANGETVTEQHDALNRVTQIEGNKPAGAGLLYRYIQGYDLTGNVVSIHEDYGQPMPENYRDITQEYDGANRLTAEHYRDDTGGTPSDHGGNRDVTHGYDAADNRSSKTTHYLTDPVTGNPDDSETFTYNDLNQLTQLVVSKPARFGQPAVSETIIFTYDLNGNRKGRSDITDKFTYDYDQRLWRVAAPDHVTYYYTYDYRTRRVAITTDPGGGGAVSTTNVIFSGGTSVQGYVDGTLDVEYIRGSDYGGGIGGILYTLRSGTPSYTHYNARGDVTAKTDDSNAVTYQATYEAFGTRPEEVGATTDKQKANTKDEDPTGLLNEGFRYRDLATGTFITRDPIGFRAGPNLYSYVHQNPWTKFDPEGLDDNSAQNKPPPSPPPTKAETSSASNTPSTGASKVNESTREKTRTPAHALPKPRWSVIPYIFHKGDPDIRTDWKGENRSGFRVLYNPTDDEIEELNRVDGEINLAQAIEVIEIPANRQPEIEAPGGMYGYGQPPPPMFPSRRQGSGYWYADAPDNAGLTSMAVLSWKTKDGNSQYRVLDTYHFKFDFKNNKIKINPKNTGDKKLYNKAMETWLDTPKQ